MVERVRTNGNGHDKSGPPPRISPNPRKRMKFSPELMAVISQRTPPAVPRRPYELPKPPPGVVPKGVKPQMAMDDIGLGGLGTWAGNNAFAWSAQNNYQSAYAEGLAFPGYAYLSELAQRPEYRRLSEIFATEMTRKWIELESVGNIDKTERIKELKDALDHYGVRDHFHECIALDGQFGRSHIYIDTGDRNDREELKIPLGNGRNDISKKKVSPDRPIKYLKAIEPIWTYPTNYESIDPLSPEWYEPNSWFVNGKEIHKSRLLKFVSRPVPDILKPAYAFGGLSMSQMAIPYINNWLNMRQNIANIVQAFSVFNLATDLSELITQDGDQLLQRAQFFNYFRNNQGLLLTNKDTEDFSNVSAPLGTLDQLLAQSQEFICSISGIPLVKYTGLSPHGLNASSEGEIRSFYDWIHACQEKQIRPNLTTVIDFIMLSKWGEVDHEITYRFNPLWELDEAALATMRKTDADTGAVLVESGIISQEEERKRVAADPGSPYASIEVEDMPELRQEEEQGLEPHAGAAKLAEGAGEQEGEIDVPNRGTPGGRPGQEGEEGSEDGVEEDSEPKIPYETGDLRDDYIEGENPIAEAAAMRDMIPDSPDRGSPENRWLAEKAIERRKMGLKGNNPLEGAESLGGSDILKNSTRLQDSDRLKNSTRLQGHELDQSGRYLKDRRLQKESSADPFGGGGAGNDRAFDALAFDSIAVDFNWPEATRIAVSNALQTFAGHIAQANDPHIYDTIDHIVMNFADYAHIAKSQAKSLLQDAIRSRLSKLHAQDAAEFKESEHPTHDKSPEFHEEDHPRDLDGPKSEVAVPTLEKVRKHEPTKFVDGKRVQANGEALPEHIQKLKIPPAWTDVTYSSDPSAALLVSGKDSKGHPQAIYSEPFDESLWGDEFRGAEDRAEFKESEHPRGQPGNAGQFGPGGGGEKPKRGDKKAIVKDLLRKGTTVKNLLSELKWPAISMPQMAASLGVDLYKVKDLMKKETKYYMDRRDIPGWVNESEIMHYPLHESRYVKQKEPKKAEESKEEKPKETVKPKKETSKTTKGEEKENIVQRMIRAEELTKTGGSAIKEDREVVMNAVAMMPFAILDKMKKFNVRVVACRGSVTDYRTELKGIRPRGWPPGMTWDDVPGLNHSGRNEIVLATSGSLQRSTDRRLNNCGSASAVIHESLHSIDVMKGDQGSDLYSSSEEFIAARNADISEIRTIAMGYLVQEGKAGRQETFAETGAMFFNNRSSLDKMPHLKKYWENFS
jgi:uncharacterized protein